MKNVYFKRIIFFIFAVLLIYSAYWLFISVQFKTQIKNNLDYINSNYSNIKVSGYPYRMSALINDLSLSNFENNFLSNINFYDVRIDMNPFQIDTLYLRESIPRNTVTLDSLSSLTDIFFIGIKFSKVGSRVNVTVNEVINPKVIIQPKSIIGLISLNIKDKKAITVVNTV